MCMSKEIVLFQQLSEIAAGTRGASLGVEALKVACLNKKSRFFEDKELVNIENRNDLLFKENETPSAIRINGVVEVYKHTHRNISETLKDGKFPIILAADHASAGGTIAGIKAAYPKKKLGVIWIDAHGDLHSPYTSPTGNIHGMPLATALAEDNLSCKIKDIDASSLEGWEQLKNCGNIRPKIASEDIIFYGVRDTEAPEDEIIKRENIKNFTVQECRQKGMKQSALEGLDKLSNCDIIYVSFDVDSMDCDLVSYGTGTPVKNGFSPDEIKVLMSELLRSPKLISFEMVEINPCLDNKQNFMAETAFDILEHSYQLIESTL